MGFRDFARIATDSMECFGLGRSFGTHCFGSR